MSTGYKILLFRITKVECKVNKKKQDNKKCFYFINARKMSSDNLIIFYSITIDNYGE